MFCNSNNVTVMFSNSKESITLPLKHADQWVISEQKFFIKGIFEFNQSILRVKYTIILVFADPYFSV